MGLNDTEQALLIILCVFLAIFLLLGIILLGWLIKVTKKINIIADKAEKLTETAESFSKFFEKTAPAVSIARFVGNIAEVVLKHNKKHGRGRKGQDDE